jgi:ATP-binding cassette subfamily B protein
VVLDNGKVVENGKPLELKKKGGVFAKMVNRQIMASDGSDPAS